MRLDALSLAYRNRPTPSRMQSRIEERLAERTRIAHALHDTVLQGILSASMQLQVAVDMLPETSAAKLRLRRILRVLGNVMEEGRNAIRGLRSANTDCDDLGQAFSRVPEELGPGERTDFRIVVMGSTRQLRPLIRDEVYRIGREALMNAFRHSRASHVEIELEYAAKRFRMVVRDNGCGIDPQTLHAGRDGHWGLQGMRERAEQVGAQLRVWSGVGAGTEVELSIPNSIAFESVSTDR